MKIQKSRILVYITLAILAVHLAPAAFGGLWTWRNPSPTGNTLTAVTYAATGQFANFVAVDNWGSILISPDGINWTAQYIGSNGINAGTAINALNGVNVLSGVCLGSGSVFAVGENPIPYGSGWVNSGTVLGSPDCTNWYPTPINSLPTNVNTPLYSVAYGSNTFVAVGDDLVTSANSANWTFQTSDSLPNANAVAWGNRPGDFVAVCNGGGVYYSPNGSNWTQAVSGTTDTLSPHIS